MPKSKDVRINGITYRVMLEGPHVPAERLYDVVAKSGILYRRPR